MIVIQYAICTCQTSNAICQIHPWPFASIRPSACPAYPETDLWDDAFNARWKRKESSAMAFAQYLEARK